MRIGILTITRLFDFDVPKSVISVVLFLFNNAIAIRAPIKTPLPSRKIEVKINSQVGNVSSADLRLKISILKLLDTVIAIKRNMTIFFRLIVPIIVYSFNCNCKNQKNSNH